MECPDCTSNNVYNNGHVRFNKTKKVYTRQIFCKDCNKFNTIEINNADVELLQETVRSRKQKQKFQDTNRIERKTWREHARIENAVEGYAKELVEQNKLFAKELIKIKVPEIKGNSKSIGIAQISDWHANELISLPHNQFDFTALSDRLKKFADESIRIFRAYDIKNVLIAHTGDILNSDRRLDELLNQATNRSKASVLTQYILTQYIMHMRQYFKLTVISVLGNESRMSEKMHNNNEVVSDNYDYTIFANLKQKFEFAGIKDITFGSIDKMEEVVNVNGHNILLKHDIGKTTDKQKDTQSIIGKYYLQNNPIVFILAGHIHATRNTDLSVRSASIAGSNEYNEHGMGLIGRAGQNVLVVTEDSIHKIALDLQFANRDSGYNIIKELEAYNAKSHDKTKTTHTVLEIKAI